MWSALASGLYRFPRSTAAAIAALPASDVAEDAMLEHQLIVHTIAAHDPKGAEQAMRRHITASHTRLKKAYRED